ncbi:MAG TPA: AsmA family protein, partial [Deltaproteobacteria bacterium]|nr:AsmA family protein [Deltaproteobacteria bacterium]
VISKIFTVTNIYRLITSDRVGFGDEGFAFTSITSQPVIRDGVASFDDFRLESPSIQMSAVGHYRLNEAIVDAVVVIQPLETVDRIINLIPIVNWILLGKEKRLVVIGAKIKGDISDPEVTITPLDTIAKPVTGILLRTLRLPVDVIISPGKIIPGVN